MNTAKEITNKLTIAAAGSDSLVCEKGEITCDKDGTTTRIVGGSIFCKKLFTSGTHTTISTEQLIIKDVIIALGKTNTDAGINRSYLNETDYDVGMSFAWHDTANPEQGGGEKDGFFGIDVSEKRFVLYSNFVMESQEPLKDKAINVQNSELGSLELGSLIVNGDLNVNTNNFTEASNGNTAITGTLDVTGATNLNNTTQ